MTQSGAPDAFERLERDGWSDPSVAQRYHDWLGALTSQTIGPLLDAAHVGANSDVLDIATGPGNVAAVARKRGARVIGLDISPAMVALARQRHPDIEFREGDATALPFLDASFDALVMNFGILHLGRPEQAIAEAARLLRPGGRFAFSAWAPPERTRGFGIILEAVRDFGNPDVPLPEGPLFFRFGDPLECERTLLAAGLMEPDTITIDLRWLLPSADALIDALSEGTVRTRALLRGQTAEALVAIRAACREAARPYETPEGISLPMPAIVAAATKR
jgi:SAM-dependent methyltransferase